MVAGSTDHCADPIGIADRTGWEFGPRAFYLYAFLMVIMDKSKQYETLVVIMTGLIVVYWFKRSEGWLLAAILLGIVAVLVPAVAAGIHWGWTRLSLLLGEVSGSILLSVVWLFVLVPLSFFARRMGKVGLRTKAGGDSYFTTRNHTYRKEDLIHPW
jgi:hypothetical protein